MRLLAVISLGLLISCSLAQKEQVGTLKCVPEKIYDCDCSEQAGRQNYKKLISPIEKRTFKAAKSLIRIKDIKISFINLSIKKSYGREIRVYDEFVDYL
jgi:hypothetical protein